MNDGLSSHEIARLAGDHTALVTERFLTLIREEDLPEDWLATTVGCYTTEAEYYELVQYDHIQPLKTVVNEFVVAQLAGTEAAAVLDVGVGDGHRLQAICSMIEDRCSRRPEMYGIELSSAMVEIARSRGISVWQQDMRDGIPDLGVRLDGVLFLSCDLGYLMDAHAGTALRLAVLDSAYERLRPGGRLILELATQDPRPAPDGADVFHFSRTPTVPDPDSPGGVLVGPETWQFAKTFSKPEILSLIEAGRFDQAAAVLHYVVRGSNDVDRVGCYVDEGDLNPAESYRLLVSLTK